MQSRSRWVLCGEDENEDRYNPKNYQLWDALRPALLMTN
jgi:hypothetical protein